MFSSKELDLASNYKIVLDSFSDLAIFVADNDTYKILYYNKKFKEIWPATDLGLDYRSLDKNPCVETHGVVEKHLTCYSEAYDSRIDIQAIRIMWDGAIPATMVCCWPHDLYKESGNTFNHLDFISGGLTRSGFIDTIKDMHDKGEDLTKYSILFINIKDFKAVNEMLGCDGGDNLLKMLFDRILTSSLKPEFGSRKESDHFVFLVKQENIDETVLGKLLHFHWTYGEKDLFILCRCGIFEINDNNLPVYKMIDRAKLAKNYIVDEYVQPYIFFEPSMLEDYSERVSAFVLFDNGIKNNEFVVYYQPIMDAKTGKIISAEALVRRILADGTIIPPIKFIPVLERTGYISMLDKFIVEQVGSFQRQRLTDNKKIVPVSFNMSQKDFYDISLLEFLKTKLKDTILPKNSIKIEITEGTYTLNEIKHREFLSEMRDLGTQILLDDFGTGYSSFGMFENYNFDIIKLDMSFVRQLKSNPNVAIVVNSIISMCHNLGVKVVAEGVEDEVELEILKGFGCDYIQGYYFSKPLCQKDFEAFVEAHL